MWEIRLNGQIICGGFDSIVEAGTRMGNMVMEIQDSNPDVTVKARGSDIHDGKHPGTERFITLDFGEHFEIYSVERSG